MTPGVLIVGGNRAALQAALDLAHSGIAVTLLEPSPFLSAEASLGATKDIHLLEAVKNPSITLVTGARVTDVRWRTDRFDVDFECTPRFVELDKCTACGDCLDVCPATVWQNGEARKAILFGDHGDVPNVCALDKRGMAACRHACPIDQRAQGYIALIREGRFAEAYRTIREENPFPSSCGRVCNHRCEDSCNRAQIDKPVNIMGLKRFVADWATAHPEEIAQVMPEFKSEPKGKHVAVVGSGPAGMTAASDLVRKGYRVSVFESQPVAGGMMRVGVPHYRLPEDVVQREIDEIVAAGVELHLNHRIDDLDQLREEGFDAILVAVGAHDSIFLPIPGVNSRHVYGATEYLCQASLGQPIDVSGKRVLVLGGGDVAVDVAQTAVRTGAEYVAMACLESRETMPAQDWAIEDAEEEGVEILPSRTFREVLNRDGYATGLRCAQIDFRGFVDGRPDFSVIPGTEEVVLADVIVFAIGQRPNLDLAPEELATHRDRLIIVDEETMATNIPGVFAGGDVVTGMTFFVVDAMVDGRKAAHAIDAYLSSGKPTGWRSADQHQSVVELTREEAWARLTADPAISRAPRTELPRLPVSERRDSFVEMFGGFTEEQAIAEAQRCLACGPCTECLACVWVCEASAINHAHVSSQETLEAGVVIWSDAAGPPPALTRATLYELHGDDPLVASAVAATAMADLALYREKRPIPQWKPPMADVRIGVFVCRCGGQIADVLDTAGIAAAAGARPGVAYSEEIPFACQPEGAATIRKVVTGRGLNQVVLAACSCCSLDQVCESCTYQRIRCKANLLDRPDELAGLPIEFVNIREQCAWAHRDDPDKATEKAERLIAAAIAKTHLAHPSLHVPRQMTDLEASVLVLGPGEAGDVCAGSLRAQNFAVTRSPESPAEIRGSFGSFSLAQEGVDLRATVLVLAPDDEDELDRWDERPGLYLCPPNGDPELIGLAVAGRVGALLGSGRIAASQHLATVDPARCRACGTCETVCEHEAIQVGEVDGRPVAIVEPLLCQGCGTCVGWCPSGAITAGYSTDAQIGAMLAALLAPGPF